MNKQEAKRAHERVVNRACVQSALVLAATWLVGWDFNEFTPTWLVATLCAAFLVCELIVLYIQYASHAWVNAQADEGDGEEEEKE